MMNVFHFLKEHWIILPDLPGDLDQLPESFKLSGSCSTNLDFPAGFVGVTRLCTLTFFV